MPARIAIVLVLVLGFLFPAPPAAAQSDDFTPFLGSYAGEVEVETSKGSETRELQVVIAREEKGFSVRWTTVTEKAPGDLKSETYSATFAKASSNIYHAASKDFEFGGARGTIYATIVDRKMTVVALLGTPEGRYEVQTYERTLVPGGMKLKFTRKRDGKYLKAIEATLKRRESGANSTK